MKIFVSILLLVCLVVAACAKESEEENEQSGESWWLRFKQRVKVVLSKWRDDLRLLWDDVLAKADDMRGWTTDMFDSFKTKLKEWLETRPEVPEDEKNEIENFISKLKVPTEKPSDKPKNIDP